MLTLNIDEFMLELKDGALKNVGPANKSAEAKLFDVASAETRAFGDKRVKLVFEDGEGNEVGDPAFVDPVAQDYATEAASPARDAGEEVPGLEVDAAGDPRIRNGAPDIGPIES